MSVLGKDKKFLSLLAHSDREYSPHSLPFKKYRKPITGDKAAGP